MTTNQEKPIYITLIRVKNGGLNIERIAIECDRSNSLQIATNVTSYAAVRYVYFNRSGKLHKNAIRLNASNYKEYLEKNCKTI